MSVPSTLSKIGEALDDFLNKKLSNDDAESILNEAGQKYFDKRKELGAINRDPSTYLTISHRLSLIESKLELLIANSNSS